MSSTLQLICENVFKTQARLMRSLLTMQPWELAKLFRNIKCLELRQHPELACKDVKSSFEQLTALTRLNSLKVHWHHINTDSDFSVLQVLHCQCFISIIGMDASVQSLQHMHSFTIAMQYSL